MSYTIVDHGVAEALAELGIQPSPSWPCPCGCGRTVTRADLHPQAGTTETLVWSWHHEQALAWIDAHPRVPIQDAAQDRRHGAWLRAQSHADLALWGVADRHTIARGRVVYSLTSLGRAYLSGRERIPASIVVRGRGRGRGRELVPSVSSDSVGVHEIADPILDPRVLGGVGERVVMQ